MNQVTLIPTPTNSYEIINRSVRAYYFSIVNTPETAAEVIVRRKLVGGCRPIQWPKNWSRRYRPLESK